LHTEAQTHFGFKSVPSSEKSKLVEDVFHRVANSYDLMNDLMSGGVHRYWKDQFISMLAPRPGMRLLDVAGGTGDIAFRFLDAAKPKRPIPALSAPAASKRASVVVCDINPSMLQVGKQRALDRGFKVSEESEPEELKADADIRFVVGDAQNLPFADECFDAYTIAFGLRNVTDMNQALREAHRVLRKGGRFMCLEFSNVDNPILKRLYDAYSFNVIPAMGELVAKDRAAYQYLVESIRQMPNQEKLSEMMRSAGFKSVAYTNYLSGVTSIHSAFK
jgi:ubiquinone/menaquinone biosynthesis methyltransferase